MKTLKRDGERERVSQKTQTNHNCDGYVNAAGRIHTHARNFWITGRLPGFSDVQASQLVNLLKVELKKFETFSWAVWFWEHRLFFFEEIWFV